MKTVKAKIKGTNAILEGCVCDDSFFVSVDHDTFERYDLDEVELCESNPNSLTLEEAAEEYSKRVSDGHNYRDLTCGFIAGAEWQASQMPMPEDTVLFNKGVAEGRRLMMEEAMEADVNTYKDPVLSCGWAEFVVDMPSSETDNLGDKVRIVVLKEEDE